MANDVTVRVIERVWREMVEYEPPGLGLSPAIRTQFQAATDLVEERPARMQFRIATFTFEQARELEVWLTAVSRRGDAPAGAGVALTAVREGIRLAE
jgi:hypothetical protein